VRAGNLDRTITLLAHVEGEPDQYGNVTAGWTDAGTFRAAIVTLSTEEFLRSYGETSEAVIVFRTRFLPGVTTSHRVDFEGRIFDIKELKEIGRRDGLEWRCEEVQP
jgi:SPP1 family predicted phage head-tail adaptor